MDKTDHLMAEKNKNNNDRQKWQVTPKKYLKKTFQAFKKMVKVVKPKMWFVNTN
jgi:hypothetical protein